MEAVACGVDVGLDVLVVALVVEVGFGCVWKMVGICVLACTSCAAVYFMILIPPNLHARFW